ncbi:hypothetical protein AB0N65_00095 [Paenarthrobacter sp. NPDC089322]|uniref:hypothetical protein n=1 Tax=Paenarthrobacter sp. NPDC089322 TaxID=3155065 RepID=UPI0034345762
MRHMGNSGKLAVIAAFVSLGLLVLAAAVLEELVLYLFLGAVLVCYLASIVQVFNRRRYLVVLLGAAGTSLFIGFSIAFLRMWGLAFNQDANALGSAVSSQDSDIYFYLATVAGVGTLVVLFLGAVWPKWGVRPERAAARRPASNRPAAAKRPTVGGASKRPTAPRSAAPRTPQARATPGARPIPQAKRPAPAAKAGTQAKRPASNGSAQRKPAPKR